MEKNIWYIPLFSCLDIGASIFLFVCLCASLSCKQTEHKGVYNKVCLCTVPTRFDTLQRTIVFLLLFFSPKRKFLRLHSINLIKTNKKKMCYANNLSRRKFIQRLLLSYVCYVFLTYISHDVLVLILLRHIFCCRWCEFKAKLTSSAIRKK
jgi:hypothetical protein